MINYLKSAVVNFCNFAAMYICNLSKIKPLAYKYVQADNAVCHHIETESGPATLQKCLHLFTEPETLSSDEAWYVST